MPGERDDWIGKQLGKYRLLSRLGEGGMGIVWEAEDISLGRRVAVKILPAEMARDPEVVQRFQLEGRAAAALNHPNVVQIHEIGQVDDVHFLVMERMAGGSAGRFLKQGLGLPWREATKLIADACRGLMAAHAAELLHRDIKPANILLTADGVAKLADFGIAKFHHHHHTLTPSGQVVGTPDYMSPEQCRCENLDVRSDIYSLGATYFVLLTGQFPFVGDTPLQTMFAHCSSPVPEPHRLNPNIPQHCSQIISRTMQKNRIDRHASAAALLADLEALLARPESAAHGSSVQSVTQKLTPLPPRHPRSRRTTRVAALLLVVVIAGVGWHLLARNGNDGKNGENHSGKDNNGKDPVVRRPPRAISLRSRANLTGHQHDVESLAVTRDGRLLASGDSTGQIRLWQLPKGDFIRSFKGHTAKVMALAFSGDEQTLVSSAEDKTLRFWEVSSGKVLRSQTTESTIQQVAFSPDGKLLATAEDFEGVRLSSFQPPDGLKQIYRRQFGLSLVRVSFSPDGKRLAALDYLEGLTILGVDNDETLASMRERKGIHTMAFAPDNKSIALGMESGRLMLWRPPEGIATLLTTESQFRKCLVWSPDGGNIVFGNSWDGEPRVWQMTTKKMWRGKGDQKRGFVLSLVFAGDDTLVTGHAAEGVVQLWDVIEEPTP